MMSIINHYVSHGVADKKQQEFLYNDVQIQNYRDLIPWTFEEANKNMIKGWIMPCTG